MNSNSGETIRVRLADTLGDFSLDVDFRAPMRGVTALFGPSGGGKTSILRCVAGLRRARGIVDIGGERWQDDDASVFVAPHRRAVGYVFQETGLFAHLDVRRNLEFGYRRIAAAERRVSFDEAVALLGVESLLHRATAKLSGGQRQRVAIARALLTSPRLLLMDEPLAALDQASRRDILPYLERLHDDLAMPVFYVSHAAEEVARLADHLVLVEDGRVRAAGAFDEVASRLDIAREHGAEADTVIATTVSGHDDEWHLTALSFSGGTFQVARNHLAPGQPVRLRVLARDVSLTLDRQAGTSILNIFPATVTATVDEDDAQSLVRLDVGGTALMARVTRKSARALSLAPGRRVYAQVKAVALI